MPDTILIIDDTPANLQVLGRILKTRGYEVIAALSAHDGLAALACADIDLILLDVMMPDMNGYELCTILKSRPDSRHIPVIFLTALAETTDLVKGFAAGGVDYITKPFNADELLARVKTHVELKKAREEILSLKGILPICSSCKKIRDDKGFWNQVDEYFRSHSDITFSHGICPDCVQTLYPEFADKISGKKKDSPRGIMD